MEKLQVSHQLRPLHAEPLAGRKPMPQGEAFDEIPASREAGKVVELPARSSQKDLVSDAEINRSPRKRKAQAGTRRKEVATTTQPKSAQALKQLRSTEDPLSVEEVKRLEAYADRINQLLQQRASHRQQFQQERASYRSMGQSTAAANVETDRFGPLNGNSNRPDDTLEFADTETLRDKAEQVQRLLAEMTTALQRQSPHQAQVSTTASPLTSPAAPPVSGTGAYGSAAATYPGTTAQPSYSSTASYQAGKPLQGWHQAEHEAEKTAEVLRHLNSRDGVDSGRARYCDSRTPRSRLQSPWLRRLGLQLRQLFQVPTKPIDRVGDAMLWIVLAAVVRVGAKLLTVAHPVFGPLAVVAMLTPAAIALFLAFSAPRAGVLSFYRLFLIMLGLVIGGKL